MGTLWRKLAMLLRRKRQDEELDEELRLHVELRAERLREAGTPSDEALDAATRKFGNRTLIAETSRETWSWRWLDHLLRDLRYALRALRKSPSFSLVAILSLAVALGANTAVFSFARAIVMKQLPVANAGRLVILRQHNEQFHMENCCFQYRFFEELRKQRDSGFEDALAVIAAEVNLTDREQTEKLNAEIVSGNYFRMLGVRAAAGRLLDDADNTSEGAGHVCVISYRLWQERFGGHPDVIGRRVLLDIEQVQIVGVTERGFPGLSLHSPQDLQVPSSLVPKLMGENRDSHVSAEVVARLKPGVTMEQASARLNVVGLAIEKALGLNFTERDTLLIKDGSQGLDSKKEQFGKPVLLLLGLVAVVLLVACANLTALLLVRSVERTSEAGLRLALGGSRAALVRHFLSESLVLAAVGGVLGWGLAQLLMQILLRLLGTQGEGLEQYVRPDATLFAFLAGVTIAAGVLFGLFPAWRASRCDPLVAIRGVMQAGAGRSLASRLLIAGQIALSLALLFGAGLFIATLRNLRSIDVGFHPENVALMYVDLSKTAYAKNGAPQFFEELRRRAQGLPETRAASLASLSLLSGAMQAFTLKVPGYTAPNRMPPTTYMTAVSNGYFRTLGIPLVAGRDFTNDDHATSPAEGVAIVNGRFARQFLGGEALGKTFATGGGRVLRVVGLVGDARYRWLKEEPQPVVYLPVTQGTFPRALYLQVRTNGAPGKTIERLREIVREMDARVPVGQVTTMEIKIDRALARERLLVFLSTLMGGIAVALAAIGLYGVLSFSVARRTREIGIRMAIGAERSRILGGFLRESAWIVAGGIAVGIPLALACGRLAASFLYGLTPQDAGTAVLATGLLALVAFIAALIPAWRAARLDPMSALRWE